MSKSLIVSGEIQFKRALRLLWERKKQIAIASFAFAFLIAAISLTIQPLYESSGSMYSVSQETSALGQFSSLASNLGVNLGGAKGGNDLNIPDLLVSRRLARELVWHRWHFEKEDSLKSLVEYWGFISSEGPNFWSYLRNPKLLLSKSGGEQDTLRRLEAEQEAVKKMLERVSVDKSSTGLIVVTVRMEEPQLAADVINKIVETASEFIINVQSKQARSRREFIEQRLSEVQDSLSRTENELTEFRQNNRSVASSPQLQLEQSRLQRSVQIYNQVFLTLKQEYELARIDELKDTPSIVSLDRGERPFFKAYPKKKRMVVLAFLLALIVVSFYYLAKNEVDAKGGFREIFKSF